MKKTTTTKTKECNMDSFSENTVGRIKSPIKTNIIMIIILISCLKLNNCVVEI